MNEKQLCAQVLETMFTQKREHLQALSEPLVYFMANEPPGDRRARVEELLEIARQRRDAARAREQER